MISSNTIVRNGMPYIGKVLLQVAPYMEKMVVTLSDKSNDGTIEEIEKVRSFYPDKILMLTENVSSPGELTEVRNEQLRYTTSDWVLFLDDDDYWPQDQLELCLSELDKNPEILCYAVNPYQLVDYENYDTSWRYKFFSKFLRREGLRYVKPWPRDLPADKHDKPLYWRTHSQVKRLPYRFYHLSNIKSGSFRNEVWAKKFKEQSGNIEKLPKPLLI